MEPDPDPVAVLRRWEDAGGVWRVLGPEPVGGGAVTIGLYRCDGGEEVDRFTSTDPRLGSFLALRPEPVEGGALSLSKGRDRDAEGRARQARPRDRLGRPLPYGSEGVEPVSEEALPPAETITTAHQLMAEGRPFSAHEVYEARWKAGPAAERSLWQGLAQLCVGITHAERGNRVGALRLIGRARRRLAAYVETGGPAYGLDLRKIIAWISTREGQPDGCSWLTDHPL